MEYFQLGWLTVYAFTIFMKGFWITENLYSGKYFLVSITPIQQQKIRSNKFSAENDQMTYDIPKKSNNLYESEILGHVKGSIS